MLSDSPSASSNSFARFKGKYARKQLTKAIELEPRDRLAVELLKRFGGKPPEGASDAATEKAPPVNPPAKSPGR